MRNSTNRGYRGTALLTLLFALVSSAHAQSTFDLLSGPRPSQSAGVEVYGLVDSGVVYVNNQGGESNVLLQGGGGDRPNRLGFRGREDLGGGNQAIFVLENGFDVGTGTISQGGVLFGRQAYVGLKSNDYGMITFGRQYDFMVDLVPYSAPASGNAGLYAFHLGDIDRLGGERLNNSVKYRTPDYNGLQAGAMYSFGGVPGSIVTNNASSFSLSYAHQSISLATSYTSIHNYQQGLGIGTNVLGNSLIGYPQNAMYDKLAVFGAGASYSNGNLFTAALFTSSDLQNAGVSSVLRAYDIGASYQILPRLIVGAAATYYKMDSVHWNAFSSSLEYFLSPRTNLYLQYVQLKASGTNVQAELFTLPAASDQFQAALSIGMRYVF
ncbi:porin [Glaciimonas soli]|uniref:Porin n=1 Tax=Glaciimonas soli TaxID=2590999 RepID=A0A843YQD6_9BURK|nr:porin [Glaciimonas soli]MQQ99697.1 porin [Glaciimonas soli]